MTNQRIFVAVDMLVYGTQLILVEFANGVILPIILGLLFLRSTLMGSKQSGWVYIGIWFVDIGVNFISPFNDTFLIARSGSVQAEDTPEFERVWRYSILQIILLVPFLVFGLAVVQELRNHA